MKQFYKILILFFINIFLISCSKKEILYQANDYVYVGDYSKGLEGPAVDQNGNLYFVNPLHSGSIGKVDTNGNFSLFIDHLPEGSTANGIRFGKNEKMFLADYTGHNVLTIDLKTKGVSIYAHESLANQPNDLAICCDDRIFASDPSWKNSTGNIWKVENGKFYLLSENMGTTNGIEVSPDEKTLYVNESVQRNVWAFNLDSNGNISNKRLFHKFEDFGMDGMRCDIDGNLYITRHGKGTVVKLSDEGKLLKEIKMKGKNPSNISFGGKDGKTVFVTLQDRGYIESFRVEKPGRSFTSSHSE